jgi:hypothetical protein
MIFINSITHQQKVIFWGEGGEEKYRCFAAAPYIYRDSTLETIDYFLITICIKDLSFTFR